MASGLGVRQSFSKLWLENKFQKQIIKRFKQSLTGLDYGFLTHYTNIHTSCQRKAQPRLSPQEVS